MDRYSYLQQLDKQHIWHPYTQMKDYEDRDLLLIDRAQGIVLTDFHGREYFDTISSWWCILHGHNHPTIRRAMQNQLEKLDQVLLAGTTHEPAILLANQLVRLTPPDLTRVFYSDNGSTACEVAVKMSLQYWQQVGQPQRSTFVGIERGYHGDTIGTMSLGGVAGFHGPFASLMFPTHRLPSPYCYRCPMDKTPDSCTIDCAEPFATLLEEKGETIAAIILEPLVQAAGGMIIYPAAYLEKIAGLAKQFGIHLIFDEVATGFGRTGRMFALEHVDVSPHFLCLSKGLTAGTLPMAATLTTEEIYQAFYADYDQNKTFYHGHTFTGNPLAAAAGLGSLQVFAEDKPFALLADTVPHLQHSVQRFRELPWVGDVRTIGTIAALELVKDKKTKEPFSFAERIGWRVYLEGLEHALILRPLGNVLYLWLPICTTCEQIDHICERMWRVLSKGEIFGSPG